jgi:hypothetical protein
VKCRQIQFPAPRVGANRRKECPLFKSAGAYSGGRLQRVGADTRSQTVCRNDFLIPVNRLTPIVAVAFNENDNEDLRFTQYGTHDVNQDDGEVNSQHSIRQSTEEKVEWSKR